MSKMCSRYVSGLVLCSLFVLTFFVVVKTYTQVRIPSRVRPIELYANSLQDDLRVTFKEAIRGAHKSIYLIIYALSDSQLIQALRAKAEEGVSVTVVCDAEASRGVAKKLGSCVNVFPRKHRGIMHMKVLVVDEKRAWIGSANMTVASLRFHGNLVAGFYNTEISQLFKNKALAMDKEIPGSTFQVGSQKIECWILPSEQAIERIKQMIDTAQKVVKVAMFTWTRRDFAERLISAKERGVEVQVYIDRYSGKGASRHIVEMLQKGGVAVSLSEGSALLHYKMVQIDEKKLINGSANWTRAAFTLNDDTFLIFDELTPSQQKMLFRLWEVIQEESLPMELEAA